MDRIYVTDGYKIHVYCLHMDRIHVTDGYKIHVYIWIGYMLRMDIRYIVCIWIGYMLRMDIGYMFTYG